MVDSPGLEFGGREGWRRWLEENHASDKEAWVVIHKKGSTRKGLRYEEAVDEAICFGWIDSVMRSVDAERFRQRFSPRRRRSIWSRINRERAERMIEAGLMTEAGFMAIEEAKENGLWDLAYSSKEAPVIPEDLAQALKEDASSWENFENFSNSVKFMYVHWVEGAKREETKARRIVEVVRRAADNIRPS